MQKLILGILILLFSNSCVWAETLDFNNVLDKAVQNSFDLKISRLNVDISNAGIKEARSEYFPMLSTSFYNSYDRDLSNSSSNINSVGDSVILGTTRYQNALSLGMQYNLFDFGIRGKKMLIAKKDKTQKEIEYERQLRNLKIEIVDLYSQALLANKELATNTELMLLNKDLFAMYENLSVAGTIRKTEMMNQALKVARLINRADELKTELKNTLMDISLKTLDEYDIKDLQIQNIFDTPKENDNIELVSNVIKLEAVETDFIETKNLPEYKSYQLEIEKKYAELSILKKQRLPQFRLTSSYYFYGSDKNDFMDTFSDFEHRSLSFRVASTLPIFDGFKNKAQRERAELEIQKLEAERDKQVERIKTYYEKVFEESSDFSEKLKNQQGSIQLVTEKLELLERLNNQQLIDKITYLNEKSDLISQSFELEKVKITNDVNMYKLNVLRE